MSGRDSRSGSASRRRKGVPLRADLGVQAAKFGGPHAKLVRAKPPFDAWVEHGIRRRTQTVVGPKSETAPPTPRACMASSRIRQAMFGGADLRMNETSVRTDAMGHQRGKLRMIPYPGAACDEPGRSRAADRRFPPPTVRPQPGGANGRSAGRTPVRRASRRRLWDLGPRTPPDRFAHD